MILLTMRIARVGDGQYLGEILAGAAPGLPQGLGFTAIYDPLLMGGELQFTQNGGPVTAELGARAERLLREPIDLATTLLDAAIRESSVVRHELIIPLFDEFDDEREREQPVALAKRLNGL